jgi:hypothetical protein
MHITRKSTRVALVLIGALGLGMTGACAQETRHRDAYRTYADCKLDNPDAACPQDSSGSDTSGAGGAGGYYYGPWRTVKQPASPRAVGVETIRGGFGGSGRSTTSGG